MSQIRIGKTLLDQKLKIVSDLQTLSLCIGDTFLVRKYLSYEVSKLCRIKLKNIFWTKERCILPLTLVIFLKICGEQLIHFRKKNYLTWTWIFWVIFWAIFWAFGIFWAFRTIANKWRSKIGYSIADWGALFLLWRCLQVPNGLK